MDHLSTSATVFDPPLLPPSATCFLSDKHCHPIFIVPGISSSVEVAQGQQSSCLGTPFIVHNLPPAQSPAVKPVISRLCGRKGRLLPASGGIQLGRLVVCAQHQADIGLHVLKGCISCLGIVRNSAESSSAANWKQIGGGVWWPPAAQAPPVPAPAPAAAAASGACWLRKRSTNWCTVGGSRCAAATHLLSSPGFQGLAGT